MLSVNPAYCPQNHRCPLVAACPVGAITQEGFGLWNNFVKYVNCIAP